MAIAVSTLLLCGFTGVLMFLHRRSHLMDELHTWSGLLFLVGMGLHLVRYRRPLGRHLRHAVVWGPFVVALFLSGVALTFATAGNAHRPGTGRHGEVRHDNPTSVEDRERDHALGHRPSSER